MKVIVAVIGFLIVLSCLEHGQNNEMEAIEETLALIIESDNLENTEAISKLYAEDAMLMPPDGVSIMGLDAIGEHYKRLFENFDFKDLGFETEETIIFGDWAINSGTTKGKLIDSSSGTSEEVHDKYIMILRKTGGNWVIKKLIWNKNPR